MRVCDIRPNDVVDGQKDALDADIAWLRARRGGFVTVACPACGSDDPSELYEKYGMRHVHCTQCRMQFINPRPDAGTLAAFYAQSANYAYWARHIFPASKDARREMIFRPHADFVANLAADRGLGGGVMVEVGAAYGLFCNEVRARGTFLRVVGIEPTPELAQICRDMGIEVIEASYEAVRLDETADLVAAFEVIEHLFDPGGFLGWCHRSLRVGGALLLTCPNVAGFETLLLGRTSSTVDHEHMNLFTPESLTALAVRTGFDDVRVTTPGRLDVELVRQAIEAGEIAEEDLGPVVRRMINHVEPDRLQALIQEANLSSNMRLVARKAAA